MAAQEHSSTRRRVLGAAAALPVLALVGLPSPAVIASRAAARQSSPDHEIWNRRLARYRRLHARWKAEAESGTFRAANDRYNREHAELSARFGSWAAALESDEGRPLCEAAFEHLDAVENAYYDRFTAPAHRAAVLLALTPAPDLEALSTKIRVMAEHKLDEADSLERPALEVLAEDVRLLASG